MFIYFAPFSALFANCSDKMSDSCVLKSKEKTCSHNLDRPIRLTQCCTQFKSPGDKILCVLFCIIMWHSHLNDMEIPETKRFIPKGF